MYLERAAKAGAKVTLTTRLLPNSALIAVDAQWERRTRPLETVIDNERTFIVNGVVVTPATDGWGS